MTIYITSDHHFSHNLMARERGFSSIEDMNSLMVERWNERIDPNDTIYYLGDFSLNRKLADVIPYFYSLNGYIKFIKGNHDQWLSKASVLPNTRQHTIELLDIYTEINYNGIYITLCHYPLREWNKSFYGSLSFHGHSHGKLPPYKNSMDIGVDTNSFYPYRLDEAIDIVRSM